jgi:hypothetical protein
LLVLVLVLAAEVMEYLKTLQTIDVVHRSPFTVRRSPFAVRRSPFTVRRSPGAAV